MTANGSIGLFVSGGLVNCLINLYEAVFGAIVVVLEVAPPETPFAASSYIQKATSWLLMHVSARPQHRVAGC